MKRFLLSLLAVMFFVTTASAQQRVERIEYQESSARNLEPEHLMLLTPLVADLEVTPRKVEHTETKAFENIVLTREAISMMSELKKIALSRAAKAYNADVMVGTTIDIMTNANGRLEITVTGYPAVYRNFRNANAADLDIIKLGNSIPISNPNERVILNPDTNIEIVEEKKN